MAGYSKRPLRDKLGIKAGMRVALLAAPDGYLTLLEPLPEGVRPQAALRGEKDFVQLFVTGARELERRMATVLRHLAPDGMLWVSWPKKSSGTPSDVTEGVVRGLALARGLVDVKVCAVDEVWSGLKLVYRLENRAKIVRAARKK